MYSATIRACLNRGEKEVRKPAITTAMRCIAMCGQAGTGMRMMREEWNGRKWVIPFPPTTMTGQGINE